MRRWRRHLAIAVALLGLYAVFGFFIVPLIAKSQIVKLAQSELHRRATIDRVTFNPFSLRAAIDGFRLDDRDGRPLAEVGRAVANFEISGLFRRAWRFRVVSIERPSLNARLLADGKLSVSDLFEPEPGAPPAPPKKALPRVIVDRFALHGGRAEFVDQSRSPAFVETIAPLDLEVHDLTTIPDERGDHAVTLGLGETSKLKWSGRQVVEPFHLEGHVELTGVALSRLVDYALPDYPLGVSQGSADVRLDYDVSQAADGSLVLAVKDASASTTGVIVRTRDTSETWLEVPTVEASGIRAAWPDAHVDVASVRIASPKVLVRRVGETEVNWMKAAPPVRTKSPASKPWTAAIAEVQLTDGEVMVDDQVVTPAVKTTLSKVGVRLAGVSTDPKSPVQAEVETAINGTGRFSAKGTVVPATDAADLKISLAGLDVVPFQPYAARFPGAELRHGLADVEGDLHASQGSPSLRFEGTGAIRELLVAGAGEDRLVACDSTTARGVRMTLNPHRLRMAEVRTKGAYLKLHIDRERNVNLSRLTVASGELAPLRDATPEERKPVAVEITKLVVEDAGSDFTDESLILPFGTKIHSLHGDIRDISTTAAAAARLALEGRVAESGYVHVDGDLRMADPLAAADVKVIFRNVAMPDLTPYTAEFAGYSIQQGVLDLDVRYRLQDKHLLGDHHVVAKDMVLGPKVEGAKGPGLPVRLAVALLRDKDGRIDLQVPVEGTVDSPEFNYRSVCWQAFKTIMGNIVKAPFRAIGHMFGANDEELELVGFASGKTELPAPEQEKLTKVAAELASRAEISIEVEGRFDPVADLDALRRARLEAAIDAKRTADASLDAILEAIYVETFSKEQLEAKRAALVPFDAAAFSDGIRKELLEAQKVDSAELPALARTRGTAIAAALTAPGGLDAARVKVLDPAPVKRKKQGSDLVASEMTMSAAD